MADKIKESKIKLMMKKSVKFFKEIRSELKKVVWLTKKQLLNNMIGVLAICLLFGVIIWVVDFGLSRIVEFTLK